MDNMDNSDDRLFAAFHDWLTARGYRATTQDRAALKEFLEDRAALKELLETFLAENPLDKQEAPPAVRYLAEVVRYLGTIEEQRFQGWVIKSSGSIPGTDGPIYTTLSSPDGEEKTWQFSSQRFVERGATFS